MRDGLFRVHIYRICFLTYLTFRMSLIVLAVESLYFKPWSASISKFSNHLTENWYRKTRKKKIATLRKIRWWNLNIILTLLKFYNLPLFLNQSVWVTVTATKTFKILQIFHNSVLFSTGEKTYFLENAATHFLCICILLPQRIRNSKFKCESWKHALFL